MEDSDWRRRGREDIAKDLHVAGIESEFLIVIIKEVIHDEVGSASQHTARRIRWVRGKNQLLLGDV